MKRGLILLGLWTTLMIRAFSGEGAVVLWDIHHGRLPGTKCAPTELFNFLLEILAEEGVSTQISDRGILNEDLSQFDGVIIDVCNNYNSPYTEAEASALESFVVNGGGLLIMGNICTSPVPISLDPVAQRFGVTFDLVNSVIPSFLFPIIQHPIFESVETIIATCSSQLIVENPAVSAAANSEGEVGIAMAEVGEGRVFVSGGESLFADCCFVTDPFIPHCCLLEPLDNETLIRNLFCWLLNIESGCIACSSFDDLDETIAQAGIDNNGFRNSLQSKANNARRQFERENLKASGNILCAFLNEVNAQDGKHIEPSSAQGIRDCVKSLGDALGIPLPCLSRVENSAIHLENSPNPFSSSGESTLIRYQIPAQTLPFSPYNKGGNGDLQSVRLAIFDISGRLVRTLVNEPQESGVHRVYWDGKDEKGVEVSSGTYFYRLENGNQIVTKKLTILR